MNHVLAFVLECADWVDTEIGRLIKELDQANRTLRRSNLSRKQRKRYTKKQKKFEQYIASAKVKNQLCQNSNFSLKILQHKN